MVVATTVMMMMMVVVINEDVNPNKALNPSAHKPLNPNMPEL